MVDLIEKKICPFCHYLMKGVGINSKNTEGYIPQVR